MPGKLVATEYDALTYRIIGIAMKVHSRLGPGLREDTYQRDLEEQLEVGGLAFESQKNIEVYDSAQGQVLIGYYIPDFIVESQVVVEIKALSSLDNSHVAQVIGYLAVTGCPVGLLINFGAYRLQQKRILPPVHLRQDVIQRRWLFVPDWLRDQLDSEHS